MSDKSVDNLVVQYIRRSNHFKRYSVTGDFQTISEVRKIKGILPKRLMDIDPTVPGIIGKVYPPIPVLLSCQKEHILFTVNLLKNV